MKKYKIQNRSQKNSQSCVPLITGYRGSLHPLWRKVTRQGVAAHYIAESHLSRHVYSRQLLLTEGSRSFLHPLLRKVTLNGEESGLPILYCGKS
jgi:hypothetical protein